MIGFLPHKFFIFRMLRNNADVCQCLYFELGLPVVFHNPFLIVNIYFCDSFKTENGHQSINLTDDVCTPSKPVKT